MADVQVLSDLENIIKVFIRKAIIDPILDELYVQPRRRLRRQALLKARGRKWKHTPWRKMR